MGLVLTLPSGRGWGPPARCQPRCPHLTGRLTLRVLAVMVKRCSSGISSPGGQGREKSLLRYCPLMASSSSLWDRGTHEGPIGTAAPGGSPMHTEGPQGVFHHCGLLSWVKPTH